MIPLFAYEARTRDGRHVGGTIAAARRADALDALRARDLVVTAIDAATSVRALFGRVRFGESGAAAARIAAFRTIAAMVGAGVPVGQAIESAAEDAGASRLRVALECVRADLERGSRLSEAFAPFPAEFPEVVRALTLAGEVGGDIAGSLERAADLLERGYQLRRQIVSSITYPALVAAIAVLLLGFLIVGVVPELASTLRTLGSGLPWVTRALLAIAGGLRDLRIDALAILAAFGACAAFAAAARTTAGAETLDRVALRAPIFGAIVRRGETACCARTLSALIASGVPLRNALETAGEATRSRMLRNAFARVGESVALGQRIAPAFAECRLFDALFVAMARAGEESGTLDRMLARVADHLDLEARRAAATLASVVEPVLIVALGAAIGGIVAAILVPLYAAIGGIA